MYERFPSESRVLPIRNLHTFVGQIRYEGRQPMLWLPRDDHPPDVWTRIDQLS